MAKKEDTTVAENATIENTAEATPNASVVVAENATTTGTVEIKTFIKNGVLAIGDTQYTVKNGKVKVTPEHEAAVKEHIGMLKE